MFLVPAMVGVVGVISDLLLCGGIAAAVMAGLWFGVPLWYLGNGTPQ